MAAQHRFSGVHAQTEKRATHIVQNACNRQRDLDLRIGRNNQFLLLRLRERLHFGGSFLCFGEPLHTTCRGKEPPPSQT